MVVLRREEETGNQLKNKLKKITKAITAPFVEVNMEGITNKMGMIRKICLHYFIKYIEELNEENYELIINTSKFARHGRDFDELIKNLNRLTLQGDVVESSIYACDIFMESVFKDFYYASIMQKEIIEFTESMYLLENEKLTNYSNRICNEFAKNGQYFLRNLYEKYNS